MKIIRVLLMSVLAISILGFPYSAAAGLYSYSSTLQVYNLAATTATISMMFYNSSGTLVTTVPDTIPGNSSNTYLTLGVPSGFDGSMIISSNTEISAISNIRGTSGTIVSDASYVASKTGNTTIQIPLLQKNNGGLHWYSWFNVQNVGDGDTTVSVQYSDIASPVTQTIKPGASYRFDQSTEAHPNKTFAAKVTATTNPQPLAITVINEHQHAIYAYSGFASTSKSPVLPLINYQPSATKGWTTGLQIQNTSASTASDVTVSYTAVPGGGTDCTETQNIPAGQSKTFALSAFQNTVAGETCNLSSNVTFVGSAKVTGNSGNVDLTAIVNQQRNLKTPSSYFSGAYGGFDPASATNRVIFPLIMDRNGAKWNFTGFNVMNVGTSTTNISCTFTGSAQTIPSTPIAPNQALNHVQTMFFTTYPYVGSAICTASGGDAKIIGVVNQTSTFSTDQDRFLVYEGTNVVAP